MFSSFLFNIISLKDTRSQMINGYTEVALYNKTKIDQLSMAKTKTFAVKCTIFFSLSSFLI